MQDYIVEVLENLGYRLRVNHWDKGIPKKSYRKGKRSKSIFVTLEKSTCFKDMILIQYVRDNSQCRKFIHVDAYEKDKKYYFKIKIHDREMNKVPTKYYFDKSINETISILTDVLKGKHELILESHKDEKSEIFLDNLKIELYLENNIMNINNAKVLIKYDEKKKNLSEENRTKLKLLMV
ncbi:hypothetical protein Bp8pS_168 [Bacillus phage vB_BpuM-BpSp]|nr:hypothetical protein Bp8pS_168 [Bacillus phage vB_BpuM-BpSp]